MDSLTEKYVERHARKSRKARTPKTFICFFTGLELPRKVDAFSGYTVEHLIPKFLLRVIPQSSTRLKFDKAQRVPAVSIINHMIGHAPIKVKFALRKYLHDVVVDNTLTDDEKLEEYVHHTRVFLVQFKTVVDDTLISHMPWYYASLAEYDHSQVLYQKYVSLLTPEEHILLLLKEKKEQEKIDIAA